MARRKKHHTKHRTHRRHRMGGVASHGFTADLMEIGGLVAGSVLATVAQRQLTSINPKVISAGEIAVGYYLKNHATSPLMRGVGWGMLSAGAIGLTHEVGLIHGLEDMVSGLYGGETYMDGISNSQHVNSFGGISNSQRIAGDALNMQYDNIPPVGMQ